MDPIDPIRHYETEVLDKFHRELPLWGLGREEAIFFLLAAFDSMAMVDLTLMSGERDLGIGSVQFQKNRSEGVVFGLRWLARRKALPNLEPSSDGTKLDLGGHFLEHASCYALLENFHVMYGRGLIDASVDQKRHRVRFFYSDDKQRFAVPGEMFIERVGNFARRLKQDAKELGDEVPLGLSFTTRRGSLVIDNPERLRDLGVLEVAESILFGETVELPDDTDLGGFTMEEFRGFWQALYAWSLILTKTYLTYSVSGAPQQSCLPTQVLPRSRFLSQISRLAELDICQSEKIVSVLTFDTRVKKPDIFLQPFLCGAESLCWSPRVVQFSSAERNLLKTLARGPKTAAFAANVIGGREERLLKDLGRVLAKRGGFSFALGRKLKFGNTRGEVDLLACCSRVGAEVLVVECKAMLSPDEISEVVEASRKIEDGQKQVLRAIDLLGELPLEDKRRLFPFVDWGQPIEFFGLVITPDAAAHHMVDPSVVPIVTLETVMLRMKNKHYQTPRAFWTACRDKPWMQDVPTKKVRHSEIEVGGVTYELPSYETDWSFQPPVR